MVKERRLGLGLEALLASDPETTPEAPVENEVRLDRISANPFQPRQVFDEDRIRKLSESIRKEGILQPLVVRRKDGRYELVAGERRFRASLLAGLETVPVAIRNVDDRKMLELALVENMQREDLNPVEKALAFQRLMTDHGWTQETVADSVGLSRSSVANHLRILDLSPEIREAVSRGTITMGHARALLSTDNFALRKTLLDRIIREGLSVRTVEKILSGRKRLKEKESLSAPHTRDAYMEELERKLTDFFGTRVRLESKKRGGRISVEWYSDDQFAGILDRLGLSDA